jgi:glycosyltransferase involved in cell wall biosynthesis
LPGAAAAAKRHGGFYAFDAEDFHLGDLPDKPEHVFERDMIRAVESRHLPACAYVTAASPGIADAYADTYGVPRPTVVLNVFSRAEAPSAPSEHGVEPGPSIYWFSQTIGPDRGLECAVRAIGLARSKPHLYLRGAPVPGYVETLQGLAREVGAGDRLHILPPALPADIVSLSARYDLGLVSETGYSESRRVALTNKLFTYLLAGVPSLISDIPAHAEIAPKLGRSVRLFRTEDARSLADELDLLLLNEAELAEARTLAWRLGHEIYNWETEQQELLSVVANLRSARQQNDAAGATESGRESRDGPAARASAGNRSPGLGLSGHGGVT